MRTGEPTINIKQRQVHRRQSRQLPRRGAKHRVPENLDLQHLAQDGEDELRPVPDEMALPLLEIAASRDPRRVFHQLRRALR